MANIFKFFNGPSGCRTAFKGVEIRLFPSYKSVRWPVTICGQEALDQEVPNLAFSTPKNKMEARTLQARQTNNIFASSVAPPTARGITW